MPNNKKLLDIIRAQEQSRDLHETFHSLLDRAEDPFSLVANYFGRGVFKKLMVITDADKPIAAPAQKNLAPPANVVAVQNKIQDPKTNYNAYGPGAEAKIRLTEGRNTTLGDSQSLTKDSIRHATFLLRNMLIFSQTGEHETWKRSIRVQAHIGLR